jgi:hypothetical protein
MRWLLPILLASLLTLGLSVSSFGRGQASAFRGSFGTHDVTREPRNAPPPRVHCPPRRALRLRRFEDGSAQLRCGDRVLVRVAVPG